MDPPNGPRKLTFEISWLENGSKFRVENETLERREN